MTAKAVLILCAQALMVQTAFSQCLGNGYVERIATPCGLAGAGLAGLGIDGLAYSGLAGAGLGLVGNGLAYNGIVNGGYNAGYGLSGIANAPGIAPASGGALPISSASPIAPTGLSVTSDNAIEGYLAVSGDLPFVSAVALDAAVPTAGAGSVTYGCGNGNIGIVSDSISTGAALGDRVAYGSGLATSSGFGGLGVPNFGAITGLGGLGATTFGAGLGFGGLATPAFGGCGCGGIY